MARGRFFISASKLVPVQGTFGTIPRLLAATIVASATRCAFCGVFYGPRPFGIKRCLPKPVSIATPLKIDPIETCFGLPDSWFVA